MRKKNLGKFRDSFKLDTSALPFKCNLNGVAAAAVWFRFVCVVDGEVAVALGSKCTVCRDTHVPP